MKKSLIRHLMLVLITAAAGVFIHSALFVNYIVDGKSMEPTLDDGNMLMVNRVVYNIWDAKRFDVIVFHANEKEDYVKRIVGLPGDEIQYKDDQLFVNGKPIEEPFLNKFKAGRPGALTEDFTLKEITGKSRVPENALFVMGDNRPESLDSRTFGFIYKDQLVGKVNTKWAAADAPFKIWQISEIPFLSMFD